MAGRPRSESARLAILDAAGDLLMEGGLAAATMEGIAARAGVSKATVYKWWPSRGAVALDGLLARVHHSIEIPEGLSTREALHWQLEALLKVFTDGTSGPLMRAIASQMYTDPDVATAVRERWIAPRRAVAIEVLRNGVERGELRSGLDPELVMDQLYAPLYYRLLFEHAPLDAALARDLVDQLWPGIASRDF